MFCYDIILVNVGAYVMPGRVCACVMRSKQEPDVQFLLTPLI
jgi:hypothetical protein